MSLIGEDEGEDDDDPWKRPSHAMFFPFNCPSPPSLSALRLKSVRSLGSMSSLPSRSPSECRAKISPPPLKF